MDGYKSRMSMKKNKYIQILFQSLFCIILLIQFNIFAGTLSGPSSPTPNSVPMFFNNKLLTSSQIIIDANGNVHLKVSGMTNFGITANVGYPSGNYRIAIEGASIETGQGTSPATNWHGYMMADFALNGGWPGATFLTNKAVGGQKLGLMLADYTNDFQHLSPRVTGIPGILIINGLNHEIAAGTNAVDMITRINLYGDMAHADNWEFCVVLPHNYIGETQAVTDEKNKFAQLCYEYVRYEWIYDWPTHMGSCPNVIQISNDGVHLNAEGLKYFAEGISKVFRSGRRNPYAIRAYVRNYNSFTGYGALDGINQTVLIDSKFPSIVQKDSDTGARYWVESEGTTINICFFPSAGTPSGIFRKISINATDITVNTNITINAPLKITSGTPGAGKVLTSDADGNATWQTP